MPKTTAADAIPEDQRKAIFLALVEAQDGGATVPDSRRAVAQRFGVGEAQVKEIEKEGVGLEWPPL